MHPMAASVDRVDHFLPTVAWAPKGPTGLWNALTSATAPVESHDVVELASVAHLAYLARVAPVATVETPSAEVIDLSVYRSRRSA